MRWGESSQVNREAEAEERARAVRDTCAAREPSTCESASACPNPRRVLSDSSTALRCAYYSVLHVQYSTAAASRAGTSAAGCGAAGA